MEIIGLNHRTAPIQVREKLSFAALEIAPALARLKQNPRISEGVILSTCNRVEVYALGQTGKPGPDSLRDFMSGFHNINPREFQEHIYHFHGLNAVRHLFRVSSSLDSQILGENQILGQIKDAYSRACSAGAVAGGFAFIFEEAIKLGKRVRTQTQIGQGAVSIGTAAVELAKKIFDDLSERKVLIVGAGKIGELCANALSARGAAMVLVANRTYERAQELAEKFKGQAIQFDEFRPAMRQADIVISSVSAPHLLVERSMVRELMLERKQKPLFFIDLGLPRNIDPQANREENVYLYNLDDLNKVRDANIQERLKEAGKIEQMIEERLEKIKFRLKDFLDDEQKT